MDKPKPPQKPASTRSEATFQPPRTEHPSTYFVQDRANMDEMERLKIQDSLYTQQMGGVLPEQPDPANFKRVLDVGCGTGGWIVDMAKAYPEMRLVGIDISSKMLTYAREQAVAAGVDDRVEFQVMDALRMIEYPPNTFDLINQRLGMSYLRTWDWPKLLQEYQRVGKHESVIRVTELGIPRGRDQYAKFCQTLTNVLFRAGHFPTAENDSLIELLPTLLSRYGLRNVQTRFLEITYQGGTPEQAIFAEDFKRFAQVAEQFMRKWQRISTEEYAMMSRSSIAEMQSPDFFAQLSIKTVWGNA